MAVRRGGQKSPGVAVGLEQPPRVAGGVAPARCQRATGGISRTTLSSSSSSRPSVSAASNARRQRSTRRYALLSWGEGGSETTTARVARLSVARRSAVSTSKVELPSRVATLALFRRTMCRRTIIARCRAGSSCSPDISSSRTLCCSRRAIDRVEQRIRKGLRPEVVPAGRARGTPAPLGTALSGGADQGRHMPSTGRHMPSARRARCGGLVSPLLGMCRSESGQGARPGCGGSLSACRAVLAQLSPGGFRPGIGFC